MHAGLARHTAIFSRNQISYKQLLYLRVHQLGGVLGVGRRWAKVPWGLESKQLMRLMVLTWGSACLLGVGIFWGFMECVLILDLNYLHNPHASRLPLHCRKFRTRAHIAHFVLESDNAS